MKRADFDGMSSDNLWSLHVELSQLLEQRIKQEKLQLDERLKLLQTPVSVCVGRTRRFPQNTAILKSHQKLGPVVASSRAGLSRS